MMGTSETGHKFEPTDMADPQNGPDREEHLPTMPDPSKNVPESGRHLPTIPDPLADPQRTQWLPTQPDPSRKPRSIDDPRPVDGSDVDDEEPKQIA